jgi:hypothetical protein
MANRKISDGVGKKIVEALKKQSEIEINPVSTIKNNSSIENLEEMASNDFNTQNIESENIFNEEDFMNNSFLEDANEKFASNENEIPMPNINQPFKNYQQPSSPSTESFIKELDTFEIPDNIAVLKKLITQLPSGVTRHTGAQIIKQTMEALGISMKSVLQEAQQVQDGLKNSAKECRATIQEYKQQIMLLEKQAQNHQRQYSALNELISLFIQTGI